MFKEFRDAVLAQLTMPLSLTALAENFADLQECFTEKRERRPRQLERMKKAAAR
jgi:hypothetical protein